MGMIGTGTSISPNRLINPRSPFTRIALFTFICLTIIFFTGRPTPERLHQIQSKLSPSSQEILTTQNGSPDCAVNSTHLRELKEKYGLDDKIEYASRQVRYHRQDIERKSITRLDEHLFPRYFDTINIEKDTAPTTKCLKPLDVPVPKSAIPADVNATEFLFGISTTYKRITDPKINPMLDWSHWLTDGHGNSNGGGLILRLVDASEKEIDEIKKMLKAYGIDAKVYTADSKIEMAERYFSLLPALYNDKSRKHRKWLVMCDDDTFFPNMDALIKKMATYDASEDLYIGNLSEDVGSLARHGSQAYGGAGVFFSVPLAATITDLFPQCSTKQKVEEANSGWGSQGDILLRKCVYENTEVRLTVLHDIWQLDIVGDPSGFYESGIRPLSLHHFKGGMWHEAQVFESTKIQQVCGEDCFLQRFQTRDNFILTNGWSIAHYPKGIDFNLHQMERTFNALGDDGTGWNLDFMFGPQRIPLRETGRKVSWDLAESELRADGTVRQTYIRKKDDWRWKDHKDGKRMYDVDGVLELIWTL
ncbi:hypothetical protein BELL_1522g00010 [Botrytis elliptica]|uniref:Fringe-like glycosyltransferase domain-containing protein n=1 Tax=Botrytis elliptica TaxID=278938 RepID=A0A4Z1HYS1_9HELO|nr:hypothetical protein EAE99_006362 [Botrytis elliptica]TGO54389.1 hypothetical protein BELL_1522g00010 [Botrytis elliptica]